jgi:uncharacterized membrane protein YdjX (TVP38/TMEM64 family)
MSEDKQTEAGKWKWLRTRALPVLMILLIVAITVSLFLYFQQNPEKVEELENYGYLGAFLIALISTASIFLPTPGFLILVALGAAFNPIFIGLVSSVGATLGEITGYILGHSGRGVIKSSKTFSRAEAWMKRRGFWAVFLFSMIPILPIDVVSMVAGALRFSLWKFFLACFLGKVILYVGLIQASALGWDALLRFID